MEYLEKTNELLKEPSFLRFATQTYEGFTYSDQSDFVHDNNHGYPLPKITSIDAWYAKCQLQVPTKAYSGLEVNFKQYAGYVAQARIRKDWEGFEEAVKELTGKPKEAAVKEFLSEVGKVREMVKTTLYLQPIQNNMLETLSSIEGNYKKQSLMNQKDNSDNRKEQERIIWNASNTLLYALFLDLNKQRLPNRQPCLSASPRRIAQLIANNFADKNEKPFDEEDVLRHISGDIPKRIAKKIRIDVNDTVKVPDPNKDNED